MIHFITEVISRFGGRYPGSAQERAAQDYTRSVLDTYCDRTSCQEFRAPMESHFHALKLMTLVYLFTLVLFWFSVPVTLGIAAVNTFFFLTHFVGYRHTLDFLYPSQESCNVIGDIEPELEATSTLIISGHIDSVKEFKWWYRLKHPGVIITVFAGFLIPLYSVFMLSALFIPPAISQGIWIFFAVTFPCMIVYYDMHGENVVDGALDNLTGVAMAVEMAKVFSETKLKHTRIRVISFGCEEAGLRGSHAYANQYKEALIKENALLINIDTIKDKEHLTIATGETNTLVKYDKAHIALLEDSFKATNTFYKKIPLNVGCTDASSFRFVGLPALSVIGMMSEKLDPCYHTRLDNLDHLTPDAMLALRSVLIDFITRWDEKGRSGYALA